MLKRFDRQGFAALAIGLASLMFVGQASARHKPAPADPSPDAAWQVAAGSIAQARCYGRYVAWKDALYGVIQSTDAWLTSPEPVSEVDRMQTSFLAALSTERGVTLRASPDLDESALPADIRTAYDRGVQEAAADLDNPAFRARQAQVLTDASQTAAQRMATLQSAIDDAFASLRAPCERLTDRRRVFRPAPSVVDAPKPVLATASPPTDAAAPGLAADWGGSQWIQVGVFNRGDASDATLHDLQSQWPTETSGLSERTEDVAQDGKVQHIALVGPFVGVNEAQAFCDKLKAHGGACSLSLSNALGASRRQAAAAHPVKIACARRASCRPGAPLIRVRAPKPRRAAPTIALTQASLPAHQGVQDLQAGLRGRLTE